MNDPNPDSLIYNPNLNPVAAQGGEPESSQADPFDYEEEVQLAGSGALAEIPGPVPEYDEAVGPLDNVMAAIEAAAAPLSDVDYFHTTRAALNAVIQGQGGITLWEDLAREYGQVRTGRTRSGFTMADAVERMRALDIAAQGMAVNPMLNGMATVHDQVVAQADITAERAAELMAGAPSDLTAEAREQARQRIERERQQGWGRIHAERERRAELERQRAVERSMGANNVQVDMEANAPYPGVTANAARRSALERVANFAAQYGQVNTQAFLAGLSHPTTNPSGAELLREYAGLPPDAALPIDLTRARERKNASLEFIREQVNEKERGRDLRQMRPEEETKLLADLNAHLMEKFGGQSMGQPEAFLLKAKRAAYAYLEEQGVVVNALNVVFRGVELHVEVQVRGVDQKKWFGSATRVGGALSEPLKGPWLQVPKDSLPGFVNLVSTITGETVLVREELIPIGTKVVKLVDIPEDKDIRGKPDWGFVGRIPGGVLGAVEDAVNRDLSSKGRSMGFPNFGEFVVVQHMRPRSMFVSASLEESGAPRVACRVLDPEANAGWVWKSGNSVFSAEHRGAYRPWMPLTDLQAPSDRLRKFTSGLSLAWTIDLFHKSGSEILPTLRRTPS